MLKKKETTSGVGVGGGDIAPFVGRLGGDPREGKCEVCLEEPCVCKKSSKTYCGSDVEDTDLDHQRAKDMEGWGGWTTEKPKPRTHPLDVKADPCSLKCGCDLEEKQYGPYRVKEATLSIPNVVRRAHKLTSPEHSDDFIDEPEGSSEEPPEGLEGDHDFFMTGKELKDFRKMKKEYNVKESLTSGGVATTDTRLGGVTFEPNSFEEKDKKNNAIRNEKVFYKRDNHQVLPDGWVYVDDLTNMRVMTKLSDLRFTDDEIENNELDSDFSDEEGIGMKKRTGINWGLDDGSYRGHLKRLRKAHNI